MKDEQVEQLLQELVKTRESFDAAVAQIRWNRVNTYIQYGLIAIVLVMLGLGTIYYLDEKKANCERGNDLRVSIVDSLDTNAAAIGTALAVVAGAPAETFEDYMEVYNQQEKPSALETREC